MKLLVTDYDNTYDMHYDYLDVEAIFNRNKDALDKFMQKNILVIATGRHFDAIKKTIDEKKLKFHYLCCNNGAEVYDCNYKKLFVLPIEKEDLSVIRALEKDNDVYYRNPYVGNDITSVNIYFENRGKYEQVKLYLNEKIKFSFIEFKYPKIKIINSKCNKVVVVPIVMDISKVEKQDVYTIGDDINDLKLIKNYNGYSLESANKEVKKEAIENFLELNELVFKILEQEKS